MPANSGNEGESGRSTAGREAEVRSRLRAGQGPRGEINNGQKERKNRHGAGGGVHLTLGKKANQAMVIRFTRVMMQVLMQGRTNRKRHREEQQHRQQTSDGWFGSFPQTADCALHLHRLELIILSTIVQVRFSARLFPQQDLLFCQANLLEFSLQAVLGRIQAVLTSSRVRLSGNALSSDCVPSGCHTTRPSSSRRTIRPCVEPRRVLTRSPG